MNNISKYNNSTSNFPLFQASQQNESQEECGLLWNRHCFWKSHGQMVGSSINPGDQTDETESPNLVNKTGLEKR